jgi:hypothetical protein
MSFLGGDQRIAEARACGRVDGRTARDNAEARGGVIDAIDRRYWRRFGADAVRWDLGSGRSTPERLRILAAWLDGFREGSGGARP